MTMRRLFLIAAFAAAFATPVSAQSWQDMFKSAIQSLTGGTSSELSLIHISEPTRH